MKRFMTIGTVLAVLALSACGANEEPKSTTADEAPELLEVELTVPETATVGTEVPFIAEVTQGDEIVDDADEVKFEVLNLTSGEKEQIDATLNKQKNYEIMYTFKTNGKYDVTSHVTARDMHTMPTKQINVTGGDEAEQATPEEHALSEDHHHGHGTAIEFADGSASAGEPAMLVTNVSLSDAPLEGARVRYDISSPDAKHTWLEVPEKEPGIYEIEFTFTEPGIHEIEVHVTKGDDIHDHVTKTYTVK